MANASIGPARMVYGHLRDARNASRGLALEPVPRTGSESDGIWNENELQGRRNCFVGHVVCALRS
jgi:hypothetical protein